MNEKSIDERMEALTRAVMKDASADAEKIRAEAMKKAEAIRAEAHHKAEIEREELLEKARREAESLNSQSIAATRLRAQMLWIERREKMLDKVFETALERIESATHWSNYNVIVRQLVNEAIESLNVKEARVSADQATYDLLEIGMLQEISSALDVELELGTSQVMGTGVVVETLDGHRQFDNTLEARLHRLKDTLRSPVYHILMGETL